MIESKVPKEPNLTLTGYIAVGLYLGLSVAIWVPIGYLMALINPTLTFIIFAMLIMKELCRIYLGIKA